jgi:hypothetical protein
MKLGFAKSIWGTVNLVASRAGGIAADRVESPVASRAPVLSDPFPTRRTSAKVFGMPLALACRYAGGSCRLQRITRHGRRWHCCTTRTWASGDPTS